jgi:hypothetical protein
VAACREGNMVGGEASPCLPISHLLPEICLIFIYFPWRLAHSGSPAPDTQKGVTVPEPLGISPRGQVQEGPGATGPGGRVVAPG